MPLQSGGMEIKMKIKLVELSLNLRIESGKTKEDYILSSDIARKQLSLDADVYSNVEYMDCDNAEYLMTFQKEGYNAYTTLDDKDRGILCEVRDKYQVEIKHTLTSPHMMHLQITNDSTSIELITVRILVSSGNKEDYKDRKKQWEGVMNYIATLPDKSHIILTGDFNHGVISNNIANYKTKSREFFNYQMILSDIENNGIELYPIDSMSYKGYMKIDHLITGDKIVVDDAVYNDMFVDIAGIGIPDHSSIVASLKCV